MTDYERDLVARLRALTRTRVPVTDAILEEAASTIERLAEESPFVRLGRKLATLEVEKWPTEVLEGAADSLTTVPAGVGARHAVNPDDGALARVTVYTDGACSRGGVGGWAWWVNPSTFDSGAEHFTTNNQMELWSVIEALGAFNPDVPVRIVSDSSYVVNAFLEDWFGKWQANGWRNSKKQPVENLELWQELLAQVQAHRAPIEWVHTRGHGKGAPEHKHGNDQADKLAVEARLAFAAEHDRRGEQELGKAAPNWAQ